MFDWRSSTDWKQLWRYYQAGIANTLFGYALFAALVAAGLSMYLAQVVAHIIGVIFNYFTFSRYAFSDRQGSVPRFILSYMLNYVLAVAFLWGASRLVESPYLAGLIATILVSALNFILLRKLVFQRATS
jgi:putative flippase GtrA